MAIEAVRGCGFRKVGGVYLVGRGVEVACDRMPFEIINCPVCGSGLKFARGFTWLDWRKYAGKHDGEQTEHLISAKVICQCKNGCPVCYPTTEQPYGLLWVGEKFYSPDTFIKECHQMGVSRRIAVAERLPVNLKIGVTWVLFAHKHVIPYRDENNNEQFKPAVFYAFRPQAVEKLIWQSEAEPERLKELERHGITPIIIPDGDVDHDPATPLGLSKEDKAAHESKVDFNALRNKLGR